MDSTPKLYKCYTCKDRKPAGSFHPDAGRKNGLMSRCKVCDQLNRKRKYDRRQQGRHALVNRAKAKPCADCGRSYPYYVMDLDHRPGTEKLFNISNAMRYGVIEIIEELDKCDAVCSNCHRERTARRLREVGAGQ